MMHAFLKNALQIQALVLLMGFASMAQPLNPSVLRDLKWRMIGPYRGGRTIGASGDRGHQNVFYIGVNNGGVWKTTDYGRTWQPVFDEQPTGSIGDVAVCPSNPEVVYVASGEGVQRPDLSVGDGIYKSVNGGKSWTHLGLRDGMQIGGLAVDPENANRVFAAVLGHPYGPNTERGVFRTGDGGKSWEKVLYLDENTGAVQVAVDPVNPDIVFADLFASRLAPWENGEWQGPGSGLYKSVDGGSTWRRLSGGFPTVDSGLGRIGFCIAPSNHSRMYAVVSANQRSGGLYRSDDAGEHWTKMSGDPRLWDRGDDFAEVKADPKNADVVYDANVVVWKSADGGKNWTGFKGAPGGDDYHRLWINPDNPDIILLAGDQGAGISVNGGATWSSWYNQPTAQLYHVSADNAFPYNVYSGQQESGSVGIASRGNDGAITFRDWRPVGAEEYGYVVADPLDPDIIYGGKISRYDKRTGQSINISPEVTHSGRYRFLRTAPVVFSPVDHKTLFFAGNIIFKTRDQGNHWQEVSPDLTRKVYDLPACIGIYTKKDMETMPRRGVVYTLSPSPLDTNILWAGTDDGLVHRTFDGGLNWTDVTPPELTSWSKVSMVEASHKNPLAAYVAVNRIRLDSQAPLIYRTADGGKTWKKIVHGLPQEPVNVVKEDPVQPGLLFAGTEHAVYFSLDNGDNWQSLRRNMPATSVRDLVIKDNDLVIATHGRSFWIMDDMAMLRDLAASRSMSSVRLFTPGKVYRVRWNMNTDTPLPPDEPAGQNPPDGAIIDYFLPEDVRGPVTLSICSADGSVVRSYRSDDSLYTIPAVNIPTYWIRPQVRLSGKKGGHRFVWDLHYTPLNIPASFPMSAIYEDTPPAYSSPYVMPGDYEVRLEVNGRQYWQPLHIVMDPRVKTTIGELQVQHDLSFRCYQAEAGGLGIVNDLKRMKLRLQDLQSVAQKKYVQEWFAIQSAVKKLESSGEGTTSLVQTVSELGSLQNTLQGADGAPTSQCILAVSKALQKFDDLNATWKRLREQVNVLEKSLREAGIRSAGGYSR